MQMSLALPFMSLHFSLAALASAEMRSFSALEASLSAANTEPADARLNAAAMTNNLVTFIVLSFEENTSPRHPPRPAYTALEQGLCPLPPQCGDAGFSPLESRRRGPCARRRTLLQDAEQVVVIVRPYREPGDRVDRAGGLRQLGFLEDF